jgi:DNA-binding transcriptional LysR family regulator
MEPIDHAVDPVTLDQIRVFLRVAEEGSFSAAARRLHRAQSAVSYAVANLERILDVQLFTREGRTPVLTDAGKALIADAQIVHSQVEELLARARSMAPGVEPRLSLAVDVMFPMPVLVDAIGAFREAFPAVSLVLYTEALGAVSQYVLDGACRIGVGPALPKFPPELQRWPLSRVTMVSVVAASHPLAHHKGTIPMAVMQRYVQLVLSDRSRLTEGVDFGVLSGRTWRLADLSAKHAFLLAGFGWGGMPLHMVKDDLDKGRLARIVPAELGDGAQEIQVFAIYRGSDPPGPAGRWLLQKLGADWGEQRCPSAVAAAPARRQRRKQS